MFRNTLVCNAAIVSLLATHASAATIGYWRFESGSLLTDSSGNANNLSITTDGSNGMTQLALPGSGNGSDFPNPVPQNGFANGSIAQFDGGRVGFAAADSASFGQIATNGTFTLEAFINSDTISSSAPTDSRYIVSQYNSGAGDRSFSWQVNTLEGFSVFLGQGGGSFAGSLISTSNPVESNKDYYVAVSYDVSTNTGTFYWQNLTDGGVLQSESTALASAVASLGDSSQPLTIGYRPDSTKEWSADAMIDEVRVSDVVLGESELLINVPEPTSLLLLLAAGACVRVRRSRRCTSTATVT